MKGKPLEHIIFKNGILVYLERKKRHNIDFSTTWQEINEIILVEDQFCKELILKFVDTIKPF